MCKVGIHTLIQQRQINLGSQTKHFTQTNQPKLRWEIRKELKRKRAIKSSRQDKLNENRFGRCHKRDWCSYG